MCGLWRGFVACKHKMFPLTEQRVGYCESVHATRFETVSPVDRSTDSSQVAFSTDCYSVPGVNPTKFCPARSRSSVKHARPLVHRQQAKQHRGAKLNNCPQRPRTVTSDALKMGAIHLPRACARRGAAPTASNHISLYLITSRHISLYLVRAARYCSDCISCSREIARRKANV